MTIKKTSAGCADCLVQTRSRTRSIGRENKDQTQTSCMLSAKMRHVGSVAISARAKSAKHFYVPVGGGDV